MPELRRDLLQRAGHVEGVLARFQLARTGNQRQRRVVGEDDIAGRHRMIWLGHVASSKTKIAPWPGAGGTTMRWSRLS